MADPFIGQLAYFGFNFEPRGWAICDGRLLPISQYSALFALIGTIYGGNGQTTFALPDLRGRVPVHQGQGPGLSNRVLGEMAGTESVTLLPQQIPAHTHNLSATNAPVSTSATPGPAVQFAMGGSGVLPFASDLSNTTSQTMHASTIGATGGGQPHQNMMPTLCGNICIATEGIFPARN